MLLLLLLLLLLIPTVCEKKLLCPKMRRGLEKTLGVGGVRGERNLALLFPYRPNS